MKSINAKVITLMLIAFSLSSCLKKDFDAPPDMSGYDPGLTVTASIKDVKALRADPAGTSNGSLKIDSNYVIYGIVTADDRSGNLYKQINIEDSTSGIAILIDAYSLYNDYPVGRKIYVNLKGLYIGHYNGLPQIGYTPDNTGSITNIPAGLINKYITKANYPNEVKPPEFQLSEVAAYKYSLVNRLITIKDVQFKDAFLGNSYAAPAPVSGTDVGIEDCSGDQANTITLRTSGYANFQPNIVASGKGDITGIYTVYKGKPQLVIRDTTDVKFYGVRCDGSSGPVNKDFITIDSLRNMFQGVAVTLPSAKITGVVISDAANGNVPSSSVFILQGGERGIAVYGASSSYNLGDSLVIDISGDEVDDYKGTLELKIAKGKQNNIQVVGTKKTVTPKQLKISELNASYGAKYSAYENTLVKIVNATVSGGSTYGSNGNRTLNDGSGSLTLFTGSASTFVNDPLPAGTKTYVGVFGRYITTPQLRIRDPKVDVQ